MGGRENISRSCILNFSPAHPGIQTEIQRQCVVCQTGRVRLQRPEAPRATALSASYRANREEKAILVPGVTSPLTNFRRRSVLHFHMVCKGTYKISWNKNPNKKAEQQKALINVL